MVIQEVIMKKKFKLMMILQKKNLKNWQQSFFWENFHDSYGYEIIEK